MIAVLVPVLNRPQNVAPLVDSFTTATTVRARIVFIRSPGDTDTGLEIDRAGAGHIVHDEEPGHANFAKKIALGYALTDEPWLFQAADDVRFEPGWDTALMACAERTGALVLGTDDGGNPTVIAGKHSTHSMIARSYIEDPGASMDGAGTVFSTAYGHQYVDTELVQLAMHRRVWAFCREARVTHLHPFWVGRNAMDDTYRRGLKTSQQDHRIYLRRSRMWAGNRSRV